MWAVIVLGYWARLFAGIVAALLSISWLLHIVLYAPCPYMLCTDRGRRAGVLST